MPDTDHTPDGPTPPELAAIVAAVELVWPRPAAPVSGPPTAEPDTRAWRWSGRWWTDRHMAAERRRPWS